MTKPCPCAPNILVSDFDGTMTRLDFYDLVCQEFPQILRFGAWEKYESGEMTHFEALRQIFSSVRSEESRILDILRRMEIEPKLGEVVPVLRNAGWEVVVASAGCAWYIEKLLSSAGVKLTVYANPGEFSPEKGLAMRLPPPSDFVSPELGVNKVAVVRDAMNRSHHVAFAGDGRPDLAPALLVPPGRRFAKSWLARKLDEIGEDYRSFERWSDVAEILIREGA